MCYYLYIQIVLSPHLHYTSNYLLIIHIRVNGVSVFMILNSILHFFEIASQKQYHLR